MEKLRELMKEHQDKADKKVMGEVLELLQREPGLFVVTVHATKNFFLGAENGKAAAFLYTSREYADEFVKGLEMVGVEDRSCQVGVESSPREEYVLTASHTVEAAKKAIARKNG